jgi:hypothetical protein
MEAVIAVNAVALFYLSAIIDKNEVAKKRYKHKEVTTVKMPPSLIEGFETIVFFLFIFGISAL